MKFTDFYSIDDVVDQFSPQNVQAGKSLLNSVQRLKVRQQSITAELKEHSGMVQEVKIALGSRSGQHGDFFINCSCEQINCSHAAAVLMLAKVSEQGAPSAAKKRSKRQEARVDPKLRFWGERFIDTLKAPEKKTRNVKRVERLCYLLSGHNDRLPAIHLYKARFDVETNDLVSGMSRWACTENTFASPAKFLQPEDLIILQALRRTCSEYQHFPVKYWEDSLLLQRMIETGRLYAGSPKHPVLLTQEPTPQQAELQWGMNAEGKMKINVVGSHGMMVLPFADHFYSVNTETGTVGRLTFDLPDSQVRQLLEIPPVADSDLSYVSDMLSSYLPDFPRPDPKKIRTLKKIRMKPRLTIDTSPPFWMRKFRNYSFGLNELDYVQLQFCYDDILVGVNDETAYVDLPTGESVRLNRDNAAEQKAMRLLEKMGFQQVPDLKLQLEGSHQPVFALASEAQWSTFMQKELPRLRKKNWLINMSLAFRHNQNQVEAWTAEFDEDEDGWFSLNMGIVVNGERIALAPLLHQLFKTDKRWLDHQQIDQIATDESITLFLNDDSKVKVPAGRIKPLARTLIELFQQAPSETLRFSRYDLARVNELTQMERWQFKGADQVRSLAQQLQSTAGIQAVQPPEQFSINLRSYQLEGLSWLQFLREQKLSGILADDMGLGKTAQTLAHLALEKQQGRMDRPTLVVLPTSLIFNWKREAERFVPQLRVLSLHGKDRAARFDQIAEHDIILTTYPLLWRDEKVLSDYHYHYLILDEAQTVKNVNSKAAQVVRRLSARHRLCLTGTPLENHLGELWSQFDFLLPGFLGSQREFYKIWRNPIEKQGDTLRRDLLAKRIRPFILRRRKEEVARELPEKTTIIRSVELQGKQRDLYETMRVAMNERVQEEVRNKGFSRSQIVILDALLRLRQVCCDPRLVKLGSAAGVKERAKMDLLMDILPELIDEGRRVLLFSQFTSMLSLISEELDKAGIEYTQLTGDTRDRESMVQRFQDGEVPVFLISLKAGGVGLNLNVADTVIHYDPWWNPAVEKQATDRAHRLGQTKNVFVYKLVVAGSIEEKILSLQERKAELAEGILSEDAEGLSKFNENDIAALLEPLPE